MNDGRVRRYPDPDVRRITVTEVTSLRGGGIAGDPARRVTMFFNDEGEKIGEFDPITRDPVMLREWFKGRGWVIDLGQHGSDDPFKEIVER